MKTEKYNYTKYNRMERLALYCAERSVGKSIPVLVHKVPKPENLNRKLQMLMEEE